MHNFLEKVDIEEGRNVEEVEEEVEDNLPEEKKRYTI